MPIMCSLKVQHKPSNKDIFDPRYYFHRFDFQSKDAIFIKMNRESFKRSPFLDNRIECVSDTPIPVNLDSCLDQNNKDIEKTPNKFLFHTAYCCSTLLSRALDISNKTVVYREPVTLHQLAVIQRRKEQFSSYHINRWNQYLGFTMQMLSKTWNKDEVSIIKATDSCNNIIFESLSKSNKSTAILLYSKLEEFIASNLKSNGRRNFLKNFVIRSSRDSKHFPTLASIDPGTLNDARSAAYVWMVQMTLYSIVINHNNCRSLDADNPLKSPIKYLTSACRHYNVDIRDREIEAILDSPVWKKHAKDKTSSSYSYNDRLNEKNRVISNNLAEINGAIQWAYTFANWDDCIHDLENASL